MPGQLIGILLELQMLTFMLQFLRIIKVRFEILQVRIERRTIDFLIYSTVSLSEVTKIREV
jgi:hypothetical protein